jgi:hypothetical protein
MKLNEFNIGDYVMYLKDDQSHFGKIVEKESIHGDWFLYQIEWENGDVHSVPEIALNARPYYTIVESEKEFLQLKLKARY